MRKGHGVPAVVAQRVEQILRAENAHVEMALVAIHIGRQFGHDAILLFRRDQPLVDGATQRRLAAVSIQALAVV